MITDKATFRFDAETRKMYLHSIYPGFTAGAVQEEIRFKIDLARAVEEPAPTEHELDTLRTQCDPDRMVLKN